MKHEIAVVNEAMNQEFRRGLRGRLNIIAAAEAHVVWKNRLSHHVNGVSKEPLGSALLGQDGICQLGNLIDGAALASLGNDEEFQRLRAAHQQFHKLAHEVVHKLEGDDRTGAKALFENEYSAALSQILTSLTKLNRMMQ